LKLVRGWEPGKKRPKMKKAGEESPAFKAQFFTGKVYQTAVKQFFRTLLDQF